MNFLWFILHILISFIKSILYYHQSSIICEFLYLFPFRFFLLSSHQSLILLWFSLPCSYSVYYILIVLSCIPNHHWFPPPILISCFQFCLFFPNEILCLSPELQVLRGMRGGMRYMLARVNKSWRRICYKFRRIAPLTKMYTIPQLNIFIGTPCVFCS